MILLHHAVRWGSLELIAAAALQTLNLSPPPFPGLKVETAWRIGFHSPVVAAQIEQPPLHAAPPVCPPVCGHTNSIKRRLHDGIFSDMLTEANAAVPENGEPLASEVESKGFFCERI